MKVAEMIKSLWMIVRSVIPLAGFLIIFQVLIFRKPLGDLKSLLLGIVMSVFGLFLFLKGASISLIPLGGSFGRSIVVLDNILLIVAIAFLLGFLATLVEPALTSTSLEIEEVSTGTIPSASITYSAAVGFGLGMALGVFKIVSGTSIKTIMVPFLIAMTVLVILSSKEMVGIAFDVAAATTGPVNIPITVAISIGLSSVIQGSDPLLNGFGLVGFAFMGAAMSILFLGTVMRFF